MSRVAKNPVAVPSGIDVKFDADKLTIKGSLGSLDLPLSKDVAIELADGQLTFKTNNESKQAQAMSGTLRALVNNNKLTTGFDHPSSPRSWRCF